MDVIISRLESTNDTLSSIDEAHLRSVATKIDLQIEALDRESASLVSQRKRCQAVLSLLRRFPNELLGEIFSWVVTEESGFGVPMKLSQICKRWREVVLNSPDLWTNLVIPLNVEKTFHEQQSAMLEVITTCVRRAQNRHMSLSVEFKSESKHRLMLPLLTMIQQVTTSVRWKSINLSRAGPEELSLFFDRMARDPENYTSITTLHIGGDSSSNKIIPGDIDLPLANLRSLSIGTNTISQIFTYPPRVPWSQLTSLTMTTWLSSSVYLDILRECTNLVTCSIEPYDDDSDPDEVDTTQKVCLPRLKQLKLYHTGDDVPSCILVSLAAPSLEEFAFSFEDFPENMDYLEHDFAPFSELIDNHCTSLRKLSVPGAFAKWRHWHHPFDRLHNLKHLCITPPYTPDLDSYQMEDKDYHIHIYDDTLIMEELVRFLDNSDESDPTMPFLESLELVDHPFLSKTGQSLLGVVIASRCLGTGRHLRRVVFRSKDASEREAYRGMTGRMEALQENGVCVEEFETPESYVFLISPPSAQ